MTRFTDLNGSVVFSLYRRRCVIVRILWLYVTEVCIAYAHKRYCEKPYLRYQVTCYNRPLFIDFVAFEPRFKYIAWQRYGRKKVIVRSAWSKAEATLIVRFVHILIYRLRCVSYAFTIIIHLVWSSLRNHSTILYLNYT